MTSRYIVTFANVNPQLHLNDELTWLNETMVLIVLDSAVGGPSDARLWTAHVEERPAV
jgi:hypothetical protein